MNAPSAVDQRFKIEVPSAGALILKHNDTFAMFDKAGDICAGGPHGLFHNGTRFLSLWELRLNGKPPLLLSSTIKKDNSLFLADLTNADGAIAQGEIHIFRTKFVWRQTGYERIRVTNYGRSPVTLHLTLAFDADYRDLFEIRGSKRTIHGRHADPEIDHDHVRFSYEGLDGRRRVTRITFSPTCLLTAASACFVITLAPWEQETIFARAVCSIDGDVFGELDYDSAIAEQGASLLQMQGDTALATNNSAFNDWLTRSMADLVTMISATDHGLYPYAGVPWYSTIFGRDGIITALETLWIKPSIARDVLALLAAYQADAVNAPQDAEPGKILHEIRGGEMATLNEVPFRLYYGSVDATPLFVLLAARYYERTADLAFLKLLWPHIERALVWIDDYGDSDGDGFVEYAQSRAAGVGNQGWKDSAEAIFDQQGRLAVGPIALCEVQAYVYAAKYHIARVARALGREERANELEREAQALQVHFGRQFWLPDQRFFALALDGHKNPLRVLTSNAGHALFAGVATNGAAAALAERLMEDSFFSGWGLRTVASGEALYNPLSRHNGSVWPHDNALIAAGLAQYGYKGAALKILEGLFEASRYMDLTRLPEFFCGLPRHVGEAPTLHPAACTPRSWSSGAVFLLIQACLGLRVRGGDRAVVEFDHPVLPGFLNELRIESLKAGTGSVDLVIRRSREDVDVRVAFRRGDIEVVVVR